MQTGTLPQPVEGFRAQFVSKRGLDYHYYRYNPDLIGASAAPPGALIYPPQIILLFLHGFPGTSHDWRHQLLHFRIREHHIIAPDLLGFGSSDKPADVQRYKTALVARDIDDLLNRELWGPERVVIIAHDISANIAAYLMKNSPKRYMAAAFVSNTYLPPTIMPWGIGPALESMREKMGLNTIGHWEFFCRANAEGILHEHFDSFFSLMFPHDPSIWKEHLCPVGEVAKYIESDKQGPLAAWLTEEEKTERKRVLQNGGFQGPLYWYKAWNLGLADILDTEESPVPTSSSSTPTVQDIQPLHEAQATEEAPGIGTSDAELTFTQPALFIATHRDYANPPDLYKSAFTKMFPHSKTRIVDLVEADHWAMLSCVEEFNQALGDWILSLNGKQKVFRMTR